MAQQQTAVDDTTIVATNTVACDGNGTDGHPRVYLTLDIDSHEVVCPYCSRTFKLDPNAKIPAGH